MNRLIHPIILLSASLFFSSCDDDNPNKNKAGSLTLHFRHEINHQPVTIDQLIYTNAAGNEYEVSEIQWFISDITLLASSGEEALLDDGGFAHYIDTDLPDTWTWELPDPVAPRQYTGIKMTFGLKGEKNIPYSFPNSPESDMEWPYMMGGDHGGYHYMKFNGFWITPDEQRTPFNVHLGVGQEYNDDGVVTAFIQNWFEVTLPNASFNLEAGKTQHLTIIMDVGSWFETPHVYDLNVYGGKIMKNQEAMNVVKENGIDAFSCEPGFTP